METGRIYDISREMTTCALYPGTPPVEVRQERVDGGFLVGELSASLHAGSHCDAPLHCIEGGTDIASMPLSRYIGPCFVLETPAGRLFPKDFANLPEGARRVLLKGGGAAFLSPDAVRHLAARGVFTVGTDALSVAEADEEVLVHRMLFEAGFAIIETLDLSEVSEGEYLLYAPPIKIAGADGAFCRAVLAQG